MPSFNSLNGNSNQENYSYEYAATAKQNNLLTKVFGVMFISLLVTAAVSFGLAHLFAYFVNQGIDVGAEVMLGLMGVSGIGLLVMAFVMPMVMARGKHSLLPSYIVYLSFLSILLSSLYFAYDLGTLVYTFGVTSVVFGIMALLGYLSKGSLRPAGMLIGGLFMGVIMLSLMNIFLQSDSIAWVTSMAVFAIMLFITMYDVRRIKDIIASGAQNNYNLVLYGSFMLYVDFINIFLRLLIILGRNSQRN